MANNQLVIRFEDLGSGDVNLVGGKNASLGEMIGTLREKGIRVPEGFAITARAYWYFLEANDLKDEISAQLAFYRSGESPLDEAGTAIREMIEKAELPAELAAAAREAYRELGRRLGSENPAVAVRSSATAEDLPQASFAGQQETFLNIVGEEELLGACCRCYASLFTDRAITYRENNNFDHMKVALSIGIQKMVHSDLGGAGVMFSIDTETGFPQVVLINAGWGLGETVVQGMVDPDEYMVFKPLLEREPFRPVIKKVLGGKEKKMVYGRRGRSTRLQKTPQKERDAFVLGDDEIIQLGRWAVAIEEHYGRPMDIEWARDGKTDELFIVQARPETVQSRRTTETLKHYWLRKKGRLLVTGLSIGEAVAAGKVIKLDSAREINKFQDGAVLVTRMTDPDWVPIMKKAAAILTDYGGRTSHAAIVSRELGLPAIVGIGNASSELKNGQTVTVSCAEGEQGFVYEGIAEYEVKDISLDEIPETRTRVMINMANPAAALRWWQLPSEGVGLARMEFIINNLLKVHPMALIHFDELKDYAAKHRIRKLTRAYHDRTEYFVEGLAHGIAMIAAPQYPKPVIVRLSDFKTNEYADLLGGRQFEPVESNPMIGWRGASRYYKKGYREGFALECRAIKKVREEIGLKNVLVMIPFCRTPEEADRVLEAMAAHGLRRGENGLELYVMCEIPANVVVAEDFADRFDGFSIGSNDLTQLTLGIDRDSEELADLFNEEHKAVKKMIAEAIRLAHEKGCKIGICGQAPSDRPSFARFLVKEGIDSISVSPDSFLAVKKEVAAAERGEPPAGEAEPEEERAVEEVPA
ncbi:MAG: phosphoenolpyruvate synthase [Deltaproteobacteria bacterium]|jgi:pyruvate,water dikinase